MINGILLALVDMWLVVVADGVAVVLVIVVVVVVVLIVVVGIDHLHTGAETLFFCKFC